LRLHLRRAVPRLRARDHVGGGHLRRVVVAGPHASWGAAGNEQHRATLVDLRIHRRPMVSSIAARGDQRGSPTGAAETIAVIGRTRARSAAVALLILVTDRDAEGSARSALDLLRPGSHAAVGLGGDPFLSPLAD